MSLIIKKAKERKGLTEKYWSPLDFEKVANSIDHEDNDLSGDNDEEYRKLGRPHLISARLEGGVKFIFTMSPLMAKVAANSQFIQTDITYDISKDYLHFQSCSVQFYINGMDGDWTCKTGQTE